MVIEDDGEITLEDLIEIEQRAEAEYIWGRWEWVSPEEQWEIELGWDFRKYGIGFQVKIEPWDGYFKLLINFIVVEFKVFRYPADDEYEYEEEDEDEYEDEDEDEDEIDGTEVRAHTGTDLPGGTP